MSKQGTYGSQVEANWALCEAVPLGQFERQSWASSRPYSLVEPLTLRAVAGVRFDLHYALESYVLSRLCFVDSFANENGEMYILA